MKDTLKKISAIAVLVVLIASSGLFGVKAQAAERPSDVTVTVDDTSVAAGNNITVRTTYTSADPEIGRAHV